MFVGLRGKCGKKEIEMEEKVQLVGRPWEAQGLWYPCAHWVCDEDTQL